MFTRTMMVIMREGGFSHNFLWRYFVLEKYYKYRIKYNDCLLFFKYGNFYELFDRDAYIIGKFFNYKISIISDNIKCGFPVNKLDNIINILDNEHINYFIVDKDIYKCFYDNGYFDYDFNDNISNNIIRIDKINKYLNNNLFNDNINNILDNIEGIINER